MPQSKQQKRQNALAMRKSDIEKHLSRPLSDFESEKQKNAITERILGEIANLEVKL